MFLIFLFSLAAAPGAQPFQYSLPPKQMTLPKIEREPQPRETFSDPPPPKEKSWKGFEIGDEGHVTGTFQGSPSNRYRHHFGRGPGGRRHHSRPFNLRYRTPFSF